VLASCWAFGAAGAATAAGPTTRPWTGYPLYAKASAHAPHYADRTIWPAWVEKTDFAKETWPKARVLVWAHTSGRMRLDLSDPANWLEGGRPAKRGPDEHTDVVFPSPPDGKRYNVGGKDGCSVRHMTVEAGCRGWLKTVRVYGNVWLKEGGTWHGVLPHGAKNTFMRNDNAAVNMAHNKIALNKPPDRSIEWMGDWSLGDELDLFSGIFIVAPDSTFLPGDRSTQHIYPRAKLVLTSGSAFYKRANQYHSDDMEIVGEVLAGTPDRPLTRDCTIGLSFKAKDKIANPRFKTSDRGLVLYKAGRLAVHSADPKTARLVFNCPRLPVSSGGDLVPQEVRKMPHGIDFVLLGKVEFDGVEFQDVLAGGIHMPDPSVRRRWKHVTFGKGNFAPPDELFTRYTGPTNIKMRDTGVAGRLAKEARAAEQKKRAAAHKGQKP
jgi:hypothetical protein